MRELNHCPFCGEQGSLNININSKIVFGSCLVCGARGSVIQYSGKTPSDEKINDAIEAWNRRINQ